MDKIISENIELVSAIVGGLIGVFGSIATLIATNYLRQSGRIIVNLTRSYIVLSKSDDQGGQETTLFLNEAENLNISLGLDIYNSSDIPKNLRELGIEIKGKNKKTIIVQPKVLDDRKQSHNPYRKLEIINLPPKELIHIDLQCSRKIDDSNILKGNLTFSLKAKYPNGKSFKVFLVKSDPEHPVLEPE